MNKDTTNHYIGKHGDYMPEPEYDWKECLEIAASVIIICIIVAMCTGCASHRQVDVQYITVHDTTQVERLQRDSIVLHDSIYQEVTKKGDTVLVYKYKYKTEYRDRWNHDSIYICKTDTVYKEVVTEKQPTAWQKAKSGISSILSIIGVMVLAYFIYRIIKKIAI